ncbi:hypothetical protein Kpho01_53770 [Kitasatospora phosalacinea]|uniref:Uncharacterized protein n=1 Tax=Kitasatospora phosalacinea TaxID=2065 RepID=A0A9W6PLQ7_9ACTN|nr:hypothetical protein Kpho01_53770 [Kitasatospora phosalacinea]
MPSANSSPSTSTEAESAKAYGASRRGAGCGDSRTSGRNRAPVSASTASRNSIGADSLPVPPPCADCPPTAAMTGSLGGADPQSEHFRTSGVPKTRKTTGPWTPPRRPPPEVSVLPGRATRPDGSAPAPCEDVTRE